MREWPLLGGPDGTPHEGNTMSLPLTCTCGRTPLEELCIGVLSPPGVVGRFRCTRTGRPDGTDGCGRQYNAFADGRLVEVERADDEPRNATVEKIREGAHFLVVIKLRPVGRKPYAMWEADAEFTGFNHLGTMATTQSAALNALTEYLRRQGLIT